MKTFRTLIKIQKSKIDELKIRLAAITERKDRMLKESARLQRELEDEVDLAGKLAEMGGFFGNFSEMIKNKRQKIANDVSLLDKKIDILVDEINVDYADLKKYEIALEQKIEKKKKRLKKIEDKNMDEVAARQHRRKSE